MMAEEVGLGGIGLDDDDEGNTRYFYHEHASKLLRQLNETRKIPHLCDAELEFQGTKILVQKNVLSSASPYFRALFDYDSQGVGDSSKEKSEKSSSTTVVSLDSLGISHSTFSDILDYIYTAEVNINPENVQELLQAADQLLMGDLKTLCCKFLDSCITTQNCIGVFDFTSQLSCSWSHINVSQFLDNNFSEAAKSSEFLNLPADRVTSFLSRKTIVVHNEDEVLDLLLGWYRFEPQVRREQCLAMAEQVLFAKQISESKMEELKTSDDEIEKELHKVLLDLKASQKDSLPVQRGYTKVLVACGGEGTVISEGRSNMHIKGLTHCVRLPEHAAPGSPNPWVELASMNTPRSGHGLVELAGCLYAVGGRDCNFRITNSCEKYDPNTNKWTPIASMNHARVGFGVVTIDNLIYAIGGSNDMTDPLTSMEVYNIFTDKWKPLPDMIVKKAWSCFTTQGRKIYVLGGGIIGKFYESVEVFDTETQTWYAVAPMRERRCDARAVSTGHEIYVFGGYRRIECPSAGHGMKLCGTEIYSEKTDFWLPLPNRSEPGLCVVGQNSIVFSAVCDRDRILVVGELDMDEELHCVRAYNRRLSKWECVVRQGPKEQTRYPACLLNIPTHILYQHLWNQGKLSFTDVLG